jgi:hypothetical protein
LFGLITSGNTPNPTNPKKLPFIFGNIGK